MIMPAKAPLYSLEFFPPKTEEGVAKLRAARCEFAALKPAHVPDAPTHASLVAAAGGPRGSSVSAVDDVTGASPESTDPTAVQEVRK